MPLPLIIGAAALATAAYGAKKGYDGYQKHSEADEIVKEAESRYKRARSSFDEQETQTTEALELLGRKELKIGQSIGDFKLLADKLLQQLNQGRTNKFSIELPKHKLEKIEAYSYTAIGVLGSVVGAGVAGAAVGFAVYGGVMALGAASTGTAISALYGAAATKATLAAIGGGSLAAGGLGIAGGTAILGAAVTAPVLAIAGWAYNSHGEESLKNARKVDREVDSAIAKMKKAKQHLVETEDYARKIKRELASIYEQFQHYFDSLSGINSFLEDVKGRNVNVDAELAKFGDAIMRTIENGYALSAIMVDLITTPIFKLQKNNGEVVKNEDGTPVMERDSDGFMLINDIELEKALGKARADADEVHKID